MNDQVDLNSYFERIGYSGPRQPTVEALRAVHAAQAAAIPFENLDPLLRRPVNLDLASIQAKLVAQRRGGYCFEQNTLLASVLEAMGFRVKRLGARVRWNAPPERPEGPRTHMALLVELDDAAYVADVGFGSYVLSGPLKLVADAIARDAGNDLRLVLAEGRYTLQLRRAGGWADVYRFSLEPQFTSDYALANWWTSTHPNSLFIGNLLAERVTPDRRLTLFNRKLSTRYPDGRVDERSLENPGDLAAALRDLGIEPPEAVETIWSRLPQT